MYQGYKFHATIVYERDCRSWPMPRSPTMEFFIIKAGMPFQLTRRQEQAECARSSSFAVIISFLSNHRRIIQHEMLDTGEKRFSAKRNTLDF